MSRLFKESVCVITIVVCVNNDGLIWYINTYYRVHVLVDIIRWDEPWLPTEGVAPVRPVVANAK